MALAAADRLGAYEAISLVGAGGMGEVHRARDPRVNRDSAITMSAAQFSERFEREARAVAALNHPNICTLYDVGPDCLVMEFVEGDHRTARSVWSSRTCGRGHRVASDHRRIELARGGEEVIAMI
ncbi:MAG TPA: hypothetical protein VKB50_15410 [Vicinamibacterales bacterium]|nr:hypothetical protein [Vicinamibacterales bacterium]